MKEAPESPPRGPAAFESDAPDAIQAQAAILAAIGAEMRGDRAAVQARTAVVAQPSDMFLKDELDEFPIPRLVPAARRMSPRRVVEKRYGRVESYRATMVKAADDLYATRSTTAAAALAEMAMDHEHQLVRVAAAHAALPVTTETRRPYEILVEGTKSDDELIRDVAATSLARFRPEDPALRALYVEPPPQEEGQAYTSTMVHGTFATNGTWWRPGGDFWTYVRDNVWNDLYSGADVYRWSGGYSHGAREQGADLLIAWLQSHNANDLSLMGHSHGCSVMLLASWKGPRFGRVVLLSAPVHPSLYNLNFAAVQKAVSIRVKMDLVLLVDGSAGRFSDPRYNEHVLPVWFNHSATHDPDVWRRYNIPSML
jgi:hypothetical protein